MCVFTYFLALIISAQVAFVVVVVIPTAAVKAALTIIATGAKLRLTYACRMQRFTRSTMTSIVGSLGHWIDIGPHTSLNAFLLGCHARNAI